VQSAFVPPDPGEIEYERLERERKDLLQKVDAYLEEHPFSDQGKKAQKVFKNVLAWKILNCMHMFSGISLQRCT
jgi:hypothetical protein